MKRAISFTGFTPVPGPYDAGALLSRQKPGAQVRQGVRPQVRGSFAGGDSAVLEGCRRRIALHRRSGIASPGTASASTQR
jgi:hypothetical protein